MSTSHENFRPPLSMKWTLVWAGVAVAAFHLSHEIAVLSCLVGLYVFSLVQLTRVATPWRALFTGWLAGLLVFGPQLAFMFDLFGMFGVVLWLVGSFWTGLFVLLGHLAIGRVGMRGLIFLLPLFFIALEYVRSELYWLKFSWLAPGYTFAGHGQPLFEAYFGVYGVGFVLVLTAALLASFRPRVGAVIGATLLVTLGALANLVSERPIDPIDQREGILVVGIQMEFPSISETVYALDRAVKEHPDVDLVVLSEYTFKGRPPSEVLGWCRQHACYLVAGGKEPVADRDDAFRNTAFVISPKGDVVFKQAKSVPIPFFADGLPADEQRLWNSPWGKIGICICYDLSYTRVVDELVLQGAQLLIVPTMDVTSWGEHEHWLHAKVAPTRAAEYGIPVVRVCSSGISQIVTADGHVSESLPYPGQGESFAARVQLVGQARVPMDRTLALVGLIATMMFVGVVTGKMVFRRNTGKTKSPFAPRK